jgi:hypothetical protein
VTDRLTTAPSASDVRAYLAWYFIGRRDQRAVEAILEDAYGIGTGSSSPADT